MPLPDWFWTDDPFNTLKNHAGFPLGHVVSITGRNPTLPRTLSMLPKGLEVTPGSKTFQGTFKTVDIDYVALEHAIMNTVEEDTNAST